MNLVDLRNSYHSIIGLGGNCAVAAQLRRNQLSGPSGPLDWMYSPTLEVVHTLIANRFDHFMELENLEFDGHVGQVTYRFIETLYNCISLHDFPIIHGQDWKEYYPLFKKKKNHRIQRFFSTIETSPSVLFIRAQPQGTMIFPPATPKEASDLVELLSKNYKTEFNVLIINSRENQIGISEEDWGLERVCTLQIPYSEDPLGTDEIWAELLSDITLIS